MGGEDFLIVGLGASAGGIKAFRAFFQQVPADSGAAYVVILHLSPDHESHLAEVLQAASPIPVMQVHTRVKVEPNRVYVIPPNQSLSLVDGHLALADVTRVEDRRAPVDIFFRTLAECVGARAVSVVLSGTGADGSMGMKRIKENGGICFAQDPDEAEHGDMPRHSIATALVDYVLPVAEMPGRIVAYASTRSGVHALAESQARPHGDERALRDIFAHMRRRTGHDFTNYKPGTVLRRIERRMAVHELTELSGYARFLREHVDESQALLKDLLISVTNFFRDTEAFATLEHTIIPKLLRGRDQEDQVRIWVAGSATGEEAYSLAMLFAEQTAALPQAPTVQIFATDIDADALAAGRAGFYSLNDAADVPAERLRRFFTREGAGFRVRKELREMVLFANHNLIKDPPFSHLDLVSCRNLLIYLNRAAQHRALEVFHFALNSGCYLFVGSSESVDVESDLFVCADKIAHLYQSRPIVSRLAVRLPERAVKVPARENAVERPDTPAGYPDRLSYGDIHQRLLEQYGAPSVVVNEAHEIMHLSARAGRYLQFSGGEPTTDLFRAVRPELRLELRSALYAATRSRGNVETGEINVRLDDQTVPLNIIVKPVLQEGDVARGFFLVLFEEASSAAGRDPDDAPVMRNTEPLARQLEAEVISLKAQLRLATEQFETQAEELRASNEELQAINEELRSSAEELETSKEELQSVNEELTTVNEELKIKIDEEARSTSDIQNLINSTEIGTVFLDRAGRIKLFTPRACDIFHFIPADRGRALSDISATLIQPDLQPDIDRVLDSVQSVEREVATRDGRWYTMRLLPYLAGNDRIDGVVLTFVEITARLRHENALRQSERRHSFLLHLDDRLRAGNDPAALMSTAAEMLGTHLGVNGAGYAEVDEGTARMTTEVEWTDASLAAYAGHHALAPFGPLVLQAYRAGRPFILEDSLGDQNTRIHPLPEAYANAGIRAALGMPQLKDRRVVALAFVTSVTPRVWTDDELELTREVADRTWAAVLRVAADARVRESEARYSALTHATAHSLYRVSADGSELLTGGFLRGTGGPSRSWIEDFVHPDDHASVRQVWGTALRSGTAFEIEHRARCADGSWGWVFSRGVPIRNAAAEVVEWFGAATDVTERKRAEEQLRASEERFRVIVSQATAGVAELTLNATFTLVNRRFCQITGYTEAELLRLKLEDISHPDDIEAAGTMFRQTAVAGEPFATERRILRKDRSIRWVADSLSGIRDASGRPQYVVAVMIDITERKRLEAGILAAHSELEAHVAERTLDLAAANNALEVEVQERRAAEERIKNLLKRLVSIQEEERRRIARDLHDHLGQQLTALRLNLETLRQGCNHSEELRARVEQADTIASRLDADVGFLAWELRPAALDDIGIRATLADFVQAWSKHYQVDADYHTSGLETGRLAPEVETNLYRVAQEALNNVYKHAHATRVEVILERREGSVVLIVEDDGDGFDPANAFTGDRESGLGLLGMRERAALAGGELEIESAPGEGTVIFMRVPGQ
jgi:PAS domain S-box-containing protein